AGTRMKVLCGMQRLRACASGQPLLLKPRGELADENRDEDTSVRAHAGECQQHRFLEHAWVPITAVG
ncbi:MAG: hypothetical protein ACI9IO_002505, partial [Cyanobium sp.]